MKTLSTLGEGLTTLTDVLRGFVQSLLENRGPVLQIRPQQLFSLKPHHS